MAEGHKRVFLRVAMPAGDGIMGGGLISPYSFWICPKDQTDFRGQTDRLNEHIDALLSILEDEGQSRIG